MLSQETMLSSLSQESTFSLSQESNDDTKIGNTKNVDPNVMPNSGSTTTTKTRRKRATERTIVELNDDSIVIPYLHGELCMCQMPWIEKYSF
jgi:hypothetical protein